MSSRELVPDMEGMHLGLPDSPASRVIAKKRSQRFTVTRNTAAESVPPPVPNLPSAAAIASPQLNYYPNPPDAYHQQANFHQFYSTDSSVQQSPSQYPQDLDPLPLNGNHYHVQTPTQQHPAWIGTPQSPPPAYLSSPSMANGYLLPGQEDESDEVIPTAIVVKNIPFSLQREQVMQIMESLALAPPYAFNYHYDLPSPGSTQPVFRGLAFANFRTPQETSAALAALNCYEIQGRRLRVEYKRVLRHGEKEKIEREKAIKRMRSAVGLNASPAICSPPMMPGQFMPSPYTHSPIPMSDFQASGMPFAQPPQWVHSPIPVQPTHFKEVPGSHLVGSPTSASASTPSQIAISSPGSSDVESSEPHHAGSGSSGRDSSRPLDPKTELDMNDSQTLEIYSRVLLFKDDTLRDELAFARSLTGHQRRVVHLVAQKLGLDARSVGDIADRCVVVLKPRGGVAEDDNSTINEAPTMAGLLSKKSMPNMRDSPSPGLPNGLGVRRSSNDLRNDTRNSSRRIPSQPVPAMPNHYDDAFSSSPTQVASPSMYPNAIRQPRGPNDSYSRGFAGRSSQAQTWRPQ